MNFDYPLFVKINSIVGHSKLLDLVMVGIAKYGVLLYGAILLYLWFRPGAPVEDRKLVLKATTAAVLALMVNQVIGFVYFRPRPFVHHQVTMLIPRSPDPSFPSDHATGSFALTAAVAGSKPRFGLIMSIVTVLLMVSRIYVGTHYPLDVLGGAVTGALGVGLSKFLWPFLDKLSNRVIYFSDRILPW